MSLMREKLLWLLLVALFFCCFCCIFFCKCKHVKIWTKLNSSSCKSLKHFQFSFPAIIIWQRWDLVFKKHSFSHKKKKTQMNWLIEFWNTQNKKKAKRSFLFCAIHSTIFFSNSFEIFTVNFLYRYYEWSIGF